MIVAQFANFDSVSLLDFLLRTQERHHKHYRVKLLLHQISNAGFDFFALILKHFCVFIAQSYACTI